MKKRVLTILSLLILASAFSTAQAKSTNSTISKAIKDYKQGNYSECYVELVRYSEIDSANAVAYYYLGMAATQLGRREEAISYYEKAISLSPKSNKLNHYATKGKKCLESPESCNNSSNAFEDIYMLNKDNSLFVKDAKAEHEKIQIEHIRREMNRNDAISPDKFKEYKDFSSQAPTNDEIVAALRTLQNAGLSNMMTHNNDLSFLTNSQQQNSIYNLMGNSNMNPQLIQTLLTNSMTQGF